MKLMVNNKLIYENVDDTSYVKTTGCNTSGVYTTNVDCDIRRSGKNNKLTLFGGTGSGASLTLSGEDSDLGGKFILSASNNSNTAKLVGQPDGKLLLNDAEVCSSMSNGATAGFVPNSSNSDVFWSNAGWQGVSLGNYSVTATALMSTVKFYPYTLASETYFYAVRIDDTHYYMCLTLAVDDSITTRKDYCFCKNLSINGKRVALSQSIGAAVGDIRKGDCDIIFTADAKDENGDTMCYFHGTCGSYRVRFIGLVEVES